MTRTIEELFALSGGETCSETSELLDAEYPGWNSSTVIDILPYLEHHRTRGICVFALVSIFKAFDSEQLADFTSYANTELNGIILSSGQQANLDEALDTPTSATCRGLRKTLLEQTARNDGDILTKCEEILGLI